MALSLVMKQSIYLPDNPHTHIWPYTRSAPGRISIMDEIPMRYRIPIPYITRIICLLAGFSLLVIPAFRAYGQNESGMRDIDREKLRGSGRWYDSSTAMYQVRYPILRSLPPLNSGMPYEVLRSYIYLDSIARFDFNHTVERASERWEQVNDTLKTLAKHLYRLTDYDPMIFTQYENEMGLSSGSKYVVSMAAIHQNVRGAIRRAFPGTQEGSALYSLLNADYVLRVRVTGIDSMPIRSQGGSLFPFRFRVMAQVLDTLQGAVFMPCAGQSDVNTKKRRSGSGWHPCIQFQYSPGNYFNFGDMNTDDGWMYPERDPEFTTGDGFFTMKKGQEAIVFLRHSVSLSDSSADYFDLNLEPHASYNALPIINGKVRDRNKIWSGSQLLNYNQWVQRFNKFRDQILKGDY